MGFWTSVLILVLVIAGYFAVSLYFYNSDEYNNLSKKKKRKRKK